jgi:outer membrane lipoprotein-sorting protein
MVLSFVMPGAAQTGGNAGLEKVLNEMDAAAEHFTTAQANFEWTQYTKIVDDYDRQSGEIYFRRRPKQVQMAADILNHNGQTDKKYVLYTDSTIEIFQPKIDQITKYLVGKNKSEVESFMVLGFGGSGHDLLKSFDVKYLGAQKIDNVDTAELELTPKSASLRNNFNRILLWIDPVRGVSVQQQLFSGGGDYRLAKYSDIKLKERLPDDVFKIKKNAGTKVVVAK